MTHDPLTHDPLLDAWLNAMDDDPNYSDYLNLIARVREDERGNVIGAVSLGEIGRANAQAYRNGRADALAEAREAVYRTCGHTKYEGCLPCAHDDAAAAIDALRPLRVIDRLDIREVSVNTPHESLPTCTRCGDTGWTGRADDPQSCECGRRS
jgi:hypothetical protein